MRLFLRVEAGSAPRFILMLFTQLKPKVVVYFPKIRLQQLHYAVECIVRDCTRVVAHAAAASCRLDHCK